MRSIKDSNGLFIEGSIVYLARLGKGVEMATLGVDTEDPSVEVKVWKNGMRPTKRTRWEYVSRNAIFACEADARDRIVERMEARMADLQESLDRQRELARLARLGTIEQSRGY